MEWREVRERTWNNSVRISENLKSKTLKTAAAMFLAAILVLFFSHSLIIASAFALFVGIFITVAQRRVSDKRASDIQAAAPEMIDHIISGLQSGLSLNESLAGLGKRGPVVLAPYFTTFQENLYLTGDFHKELERAKSELAQPSTDLIIEALLISKTLGGTELMSILRLLGNFIREDLALRREIAVKQNWIKNSAHLSAGAPWILLLLLSTQRSTAEAFSNSAGVMILSTGLLLTAIAYLWMNKLGEIPEPARIFAGKP
jgi:tight adherence protein B